MSKSLRRVVTEYRELADNLPPIQCRDGFFISVQASVYHYSLDARGRRPLFQGYPPPKPALPWRSVECGFPSERPEPWSVWREFAEDPDNPTGTVYPFVPVDVVSALIQLHGGEVRW